MTSPIAELFTVSTQRQDAEWAALIADQPCHYLDRKCVKVRKSQPEISIGTCTIRHGMQMANEVIVCPHRFLERGQIFFDCLHLLTRHEPGNELHRVGEIEIPGGNVDYFLVSVRDGRVVDFVGIELQALDTTGTIWPARQQFLQETGVITSASDEARPFGINWKMTAKTTLVQLHHKIETFENLGKHMVLVMQDKLFGYMQREFNFAHIDRARLGDAMHFHTYTLQPSEADYRLTFQERFSTDTHGIAAALGLQSSAKVEMEVIVSALQNKLSARTLLHL